MPAVREGDGRLRDHPAQVLARGQPRGADPPPREPHRRPAQGLEAVGHGPEVLQPLVRLLPRPRRHVRAPPTPPGRPGTSRTPTTRSAAGSTSSPTCSTRSPTSRSRPADVTLPKRQKAPVSTRSRTCRCATSRRHSDFGRRGARPTLTFPSPCNSGAAVGTPRTRWRILLSRGQASVADPGVRRWPGPWNKPL